jgi:hypothetical protein
MLRSFGLASALAALLASHAACGGIVDYYEDGDDGAGLAGSTGSSSQDDVDEACAKLCSLECAGGGDPSCAEQCAAAAPPGCEAELAELLGCMVEDIARIDPVTCEGLGLCVGQATSFARCACEVDGGPGPF